MCGMSEGHPSLGVRHLQVCPCLRCRQGLLSCTCTQQRNSTLHSIYILIVQILYSTPKCHSAASDDRVTPSSKPWWRYVGWGVVWVQDGKQPDSVKTTLNQQGINLSVAPAEWTLLDYNKRGLNRKTLRASVHYNNTEDEIDRFTAALQRL